MSKSERLISVDACTLARRIMTGGEEVNLRSGGGGVITVRGYKELVPVIDLTQSSEE